MPSSTSEDFPQADPKATRQLHRSGLLGLIAVCGWFLFKNSDDLSLQTLAGVGVLILAALPALRWARLQRRWFPVFEIACLVYVTFYAIPLLSDHSELAAFPEGTITEAGGLVLMFLAAANIAFESLKVRARPPPWTTTTLLPENIQRFVPLGLLLCTVHIYVANFTNLVPRNLEGSLRALFFGIGTVSIFILARQAGLGRLSRRMTGFFLVTLTTQLVLLFSQLYLIGGISLFALAVIAYSSASRRVPWVLCGTTVAVVAFLHLGKPGMRQIYWQGGKPAPSLTELPGFFYEWATCSAAALEPDPEKDETPSNLFERASLIQMLCLCVDRIPSLRPFMDGETYIDLPAQFIPRFFWPDKPSGLHSNIRLALYFGLVTEESADSVSIAFGMVSEAYANFGYVGVIALGALMGLCGRFLSELSISASMFSALGLLMILLTAWSFQIELVLATWAGSLFQAAVLCIGGPLLYRRFTHA